MSVAFQSDVATIPDPLSQFRVTMYGNVYVAQVVRQQPFDAFHSGKKPNQISMGKSVNNEPACIERCSLNLRRLQRRAIQLIMKQAGVLVNFGTGYGKTLTAVVASQCWLDQSRRNRVLVLTPTSLVQNFWDGTKKYGRLHHRKHYRVMSYRAYVQKQRYWCTVVKKNPTMLILDEVHGLRRSCLAFAGHSFSAPLGCCACWRGQPFCMSCAHGW